MLETLSLLVRTRLLLVHPEELWAHSEVREEVPVHDRNRRRNRWDWRVSPKTPRYGQLRAVYQVILGVTGLAEGEDR